VEFFISHASHGTVESARPLAQVVVSPTAHVDARDRLVSGAGDRPVRPLLGPPMAARVLAFPATAGRLRVAIDNPSELAAVGVEG